MFEPDTKPEDPPRDPQPVRLVMNNQTISIFKGVEYNDEIMSFDIIKAELKPSTTKEYCFVIEQKGIKRAQLCPFIGGQGGPEFIKEWEYDYDLFRNKCNKPRLMIDIENEFNKKLDDKIVNVLFNIRMKPKMD